MIPQDINHIHLVNIYTRDNRDVSESSVPGSMTGTCFKNMLSPSVVNIIGIACNTFPIDVKKIIGPVTIRGEGIGDLYFYVIIDDMDIAVCGIIRAST